MGLHNENEFANDVCEHILAHSFLYAKTDAAVYDRQLTLFPPDVLTWVQETQPDAWDAQ
jgi:type I restriction enzyme, R subunit